MNARQTTGRELSADDVFIGLLDYGLFTEKLPPCFSSEGLAALLPRSLRKIATEKDWKKLGKLISNQTRGHVRYQVMRDVNIPRHMGIPHPQSYAAQCLAIRRCWDKIKRHCAKPKKPVSRIFVRQTGQDRVFEMSYKGAERFEVEEQELGFLIGSRFVVQADISTCFPSIYTHSIAWALHGRKKAKISRGDLSLSGNILDKATQALRDSQTNGLLIGPHSSNILSEIILTTVDDALLKKGYQRLNRHIDDYRYYARNHEEAEKFVRDLGLALREFELSLNEKKTRILPLPRPQTEYWVRELNAFEFPPGDIRFGTVRNFLDLALHLAQGAGTSAVLNYAIKMIPGRLNERARRLFTLEAANLALSYPYLAPFLDEHVFGKHLHPETNAHVSQFVGELMMIGIQRIYPDAIAHALYLAIKHNVTLPQSEAELRKAVNIDDCICDVLLLEYATRKFLGKIRAAVRKRADNLKGLDPREQDPFWPLIYKTWSAAELRSNGQDFLADLKHSSFAFLRI
jgi:hypothetical protein